MIRKAIATGLMAVSMTAVGTAAMAQTDWPSRPIQVVVPGSAGGDTDFNARTMAKYFTELTGVSMVVSNVAGGGGTVGSEQVRQGATDGTIMLFAHTGQLIVNETAGLADYGYDAFDICCIPAIDKGAVFVAGPKAGVETLDELIEKAKAEPDSIIYGTELGSFSHLQGLIFESLAGVQFRMVDTGPAAEKITALLGERIDLGAIAYGSVQDYAGGGPLKILAQPNQERNPLIDQVPTFTESNLDFVMDKPYIIAFPDGTDEAVVARMSERMEEITQIPEYATELEQGFRQPVSFLGTQEAIDLLEATRQDYSQYQDALRQTQ